MSGTLDIPGKFEGDVTNVQLVSVQTDKDMICVMSPSAVMSKQEALIHAAWIVALADQSEDFEEFRRILRAVLNT